MCTGVEIVMIAGAAMGAASTAQSMSVQSKQARNAARAGATNAGAAMYNAELIRQQSEEQAERIIENGQRFRSQQVVQQAQSGVVIGEGSAAAVVQDTENLAARDALVTLYSGIDGIIEQDQSAKYALMAGNNQAKAATGAQLATLIGGLGNLASQYTTYKQLTTPRAA